MPVTPLSGLVYSMGEDQPNGPAQQQALAVSADGKLIMRFANATVRDSAFSTAQITPAAGMVAWLDASRGFSYFDGTAWTLLGPGSELGRNVVSGSTATSASFVKVTTGAKFTITIPVRRKLAVHYSLNGHSETGANHANSVRAYLTRRTGSGTPTASDAVIHRAHSNLGDAGIDATCADTWPDTLDPGTYTYGLLFEARGGTGHKDDDAGSAPAFIAVYDAGPG